MSDAHCQYTEAVVISCNFGEAPTNVCCLGLLAFSDEKFAQLLRTNNRLCRAFNLMTCKDTDVKDSELDEVDRACMVFVEYALLNRARFACAQKWNFKENYSSVQEDAETTENVRKCLDMELEYVEGLLHRCNSDDAMKMKAQVARWLSVVPGPDDDDQEMDENDDNSKDNGEDGGNQKPVLIVED